MDIENAIVKYLTNESDSVDLDALSKWIENPDNIKRFENYVKTHYEVTLAMNRPDVENIKKTLLKRIKKDKNPIYRFKISSVLKYAALVFLVLGLSYFLQEAIPNMEQKKEKVLVPKEESITIQLNNGTLQTINLDDDTQIKGEDGKVIGKQNKSQLRYTAPKGEKRLADTTLNVPTGKRFDVVLSDGTHVFLNANTTLRYPVNFTKDSTRNVFLTGEAYFDVAKDKARPFIVHADSMKIKVLGTRFNVSHYFENQSINTVLVEGSVEIYNREAENSTGSQPTLLKPGFKAEWDKSNHNISMKNVDTRVYTAWVEGKLIFRNTTFFHIRKALERQYNVTIKTNNQDLDKQLFDATFDIETIEEVLESFNKSYAIEYDIIDNEVLIR